MENVGSFFASRHAVFAALAPLFIVGLLGINGCGGGGKKEATADTGTQNGSLSTVQITPAPGSVFISRSTTFRLSWTAQNPPPPTFTAALIRYKESDGSSSSSAQSSNLNRQGDSFTWDLKRSDNFDLESPSVYYVELTSGPEQVRAVYVVSSDRSVSIASAPAADTSRAADTNGGDALVHSVSVPAAP